MSTGGSMDYEASSSERLIAHYRATQGLPDLKENEAVEYRRHPDGDWLPGVFLGWERKSPLLARVAPHPSGEAGIVRLENLRRPLPPVQPPVETPRQQAERQRREAHAKRDALQGRALDAAQRLTSLGYPAFQDWDGDGRPRVAVQTETAAGLASELEDWREEPGILPPRERTYRVMRVPATITWDDQGRGTYQFAVPAGVLLDSFLRPLGKDVEILAEILPETLEAENLLRTGGVVTHEPPGFVLDNPNNPSPGPGEKL